MTCIVARIEENLKGFRRNVQYKKCSLESLIWPYKFLESLAKDKIESMLENFSPTRMHLQKNERACHAYIFHLHIDKGNEENSRLICIISYRIRIEMICDQEQEPWMKELTGYDRWIKSVIIYVDRDCMWN